MPKPKPESFELPFYNSTSFPLAVKGQISKVEFDKEQAEVLRYHQFVVKEYFTKTDARGLLICHGMGQGKTRLAVSIADHVRQFDPDRQIIVLSAKSLEANFRKELTAYTKHGDDYIDEHYKFVSLNSSNMYRKISNVDKTTEQSELEKRLGNFMDDMVRDSALEGSMLIIDEAHNLFNSITNGAKNALALYDLIMETKNIRLILMSGTPIINDPFELVPCFNMLRGPIRVVGGDDEDESDDAQDSVQDNEVVQDDIEPNAQDSEPNTQDNEPNTQDDKKDKKAQGPRFKASRFEKTKAGKKSNSGKKQTMTNLFSENIAEFEEYFVNRDEKSIKNKDKFTNRIYGLSSYYGDLFFSSEKNKPGFPTELEIQIEKVPMSQTQFARYISARILEQDETKMGYRVKDSRFSAASGGSSTYRVKSRQISNYCIPEYALGPVRGAKSREKFIDRITIDDLQNTDDFSPKMSRILQRIEKHDGQRGIVYSQFVSGEGIGIFARVLEANGMIRYGKPTGSSADDFGIKAGKTPKVFAMLSGDIDPDERAAIIQQYNQADKPIDILLLSSAVAEGIDLKRTRHVHVMEPFWNYARINQVKTRAIRYLSHEDLPESEQNVQVYIYLSDYPTNYPKSKIKELTTDLDLYKKSIDNMQIIDTFMLAIAESSIDCAVHHGKLDAPVQDKIKCKLCSPDNMPLYHPLLHRDMELPSGCREYSERKISVEEIVLPDVAEKFYYKKEIINGNPEISLYHFNKKLNGYAPLLRTNPLYADIMTAVVLKN